MRSWRLYFREMDWWLATGAALLVSIGLAVLYSTTVGQDQKNSGIFFKQLILTVAGVVVFVVVSTTDYHSWRAGGLVLYIVTFVLLIAVLLIGHTINGSKGWLGLGTWRFQPVEVAKAAVVLMLGAYLSRRARQLTQFRYIIQSFLLVAVLSVLVLLQPDFGSAAVLLILWIGTLLITGIRRKFVLSFVLLALGIFLVSWLWLFKPYQKDRLKIFLFPSAATQSVGYNVRQAIIAVGSGEMYGRGLGQGSQGQLRFLPEASTDFLFAVMGEELGFLGVAVVLALFALMLGRLLFWLWRVRDDFAAFVLLGIILLFSLELFVNAGMNMGIFPVVGIPLPLLSAGGSALIMHLFLLGVAESIARFEKRSGYSMSGVGVI